MMKKILTFETPSKIASLLSLLVLAIGLVGSPLALAQERILAYDSDVRINADGSLDVEERIRVRAEGKNIRRGIFRDFPTRYRDKAGNRHVVDFQMLEVLRDNQPEPWFTEKRYNGVRINTGDDRFLRTPAEYVFTLRFRTTRQLGFFDAHDELYWNAIGTGWDFPVDSATVNVYLPEPVSVSEMHAEGYTGKQGSQQQHYRATLPADGHARWQLTQPLPANHGMTIVLTFPKGMIAEPSRITRAWWLLRDNIGILIALFGFVILCVYSVWRWNKVGRDPKPGIIIARYMPPTGYSPAALRFIQRMGADNRCVTSDLLALAVEGRLAIERKKGLIKEDWMLERNESRNDEPDLPSHAALLKGLFRKGTTLELKDRNHRILQRATLAHTKVLENAYNKRMFHRHHGSVAVAVLIGGGSIALAWLAGGGAGMLAILGIAVLMLVVVWIFARLVRAPTIEGRKVLDEIEGLKLYLSVAEKDDLARLQGPEAPPELDAKRFEELLPYAVALDVEDAWSKKFTLAVGAAAAAATTAGISWYRGGGMKDLNQLTSAVGKSLSSSIASASSPPGSSSGSGGGGSSGGGGGGGGGGGR